MAVLLSHFFMTHNRVYMINTNDDGFQLTQLSLTKDMGILIKATFLHSQGERERWAPAKTDVAFLMFKWVGPDKMFLCVSYVIGRA